MSHTVWILSESREDDDWDHSTILDYEKTLNKCCAKLNVKPLSDFYDYSILAEEIGDVSPANYSDALQVKRTLTNLIESLKKLVPDNIKQAGELINELEDCLKKVELAILNNEKVRVAIVP